MAETQTRPMASRGRGSGRASRGGFSSRGARSAPRATEADLAPPEPSLDEQGAMGQLKKTYATELETLKELFPDWTDDDLVLALADTDGDLARTIERISEGNVSQFSDVKKKTKEKARIKKDTVPGSEPTSTATRGRGRGGLESSRGGRGRGSERGGRGRGGRGASAADSGTRSASAAISVPTTETTGWGAPAVTDIASGIDSWDQPATNAADDPWVSGKPSMDTAATAVAPEVVKSSLIPEGTKKSWASMLSTPKPPPVVPKPQVQAPELIAAAEPTVDEPTTNDANTGIEAVSGPPLVDTLSSEVAQTPPDSMDAGLILTPPKDRLTEDNLEHLPDYSVPVATETVASTRDASSIVGSGTPYASSQHLPTAGRPPMGGYATSAWKAAGTPGRTASFQKRMMEQREAVVMPSNHVVDRAAVQFGSMRLNGDSKPLDVDDDREETQTRAPVAQSPPSQPRASLPPISHLQQQQHGTGPDAATHESVPTPRQAPGLPGSVQAPPSTIGGPVGSQIPQQQNLNHYGRYGTGPLSQETHTSGQKPYDPLSQQANYPQSQDTYPITSQAMSTPHQTQAQNAYSQGPNDYSAYGSEQQRYQSYYSGSYGQQNPSSQLDQHAMPQRSGSAFAGGDSSYASNQQAPNTQSRFSENQPASGHTTPNPAALQSQLGGQPQQVHHAQGQPQGQSTGGYPYGNPYGYGGGSYNYGGGSYMNQYSNNNFYNQQGYGAPYGGKGSMYGQGGQGYGISPQTSYEQSASPANAGAFTNSMRGSDNAHSGGLGEYGRSGSTQPVQQSSTSASYPGHNAESYGRNGGAYGSGYGQQQQPIDDSLKPYANDSSKVGPSPALNQPGRTGSATNAAGHSQVQSSYQQQQSQQGFGNYPGHHTSQGSGYGSISGLGGTHQGTAQTHQSSGGYGGYAGFGNNNNNYQYGARGGWGSNNYGGGH